MNFKSKKPKIKDRISFGFGLLIGIFVDFFSEKGSIDKNWFLDGVFADTFPDDKDDFLLDSLTTEQLLKELQGESAMNEPDHLPPLDEDDDDKFNFNKFLEDK